VKAACFDTAKSSPLFGGWTMRSESLTLIRTSTSWPRGARRT
jgi:hypothetical protein